MNYDILENNRYVDQFFYQHLGQRIDNKSSDFVVSSLKLGEDALQDWLDVNLSLELYVIGLKFY